MYVYNEIDQRLVDERVAEFRDQTERFLGGRLSEDEFRDLRLRNGLYIQRHAPMLRVSIPYGELSTTQLRMLARIARDYSKGFGHFTTRQNIQYHWPKLEEVPDILALLATVQMHAIQTSGNCLRNVSADHLSGVALDEIEDARPYAEIIRQHFGLHPEFLYLPRKFKIAVSGREQDGAATWLHDIGLRLVKNDEGRVGFRVLVGGGLGRTPVIGEVIRDFLEVEELLSYLEAILRVYNLGGDRKNKFKARIKIQVRNTGLPAFQAAVEAEHERIQGGALTLTKERVDAMKAYFTAPAFRDDARDAEAALERLVERDAAFARWLRRNTKPHKQPGYRVVWVSLKPKGRPPGDCTADEMDALAALADRYSFGEVRVVHDQNLLLPHVEAKDLYAVFEGLSALGLARPNIGTLTDMICCPGLDFCNLANAYSHDVAAKLNERFDDLDYLYDLGEIQLKMSGCINACGHHHAGHIGVLGVDKKGESYYQILLGGSPGDDASIGRWIGPALTADGVVDAISNMLERFVALREGEERFLDCVRRVGIAPFAEAAYGAGAEEVQ